MAATIRSITERRHQDFDLDSRWIVIDARLVQLGTSDPKRPAETEIRTNAAKLAFDELGALVGVISEDITHVRIRIAAAIGIAAVFVTQIPLNDLRGLPNMGQWLTVVGVILLMGAAASLFQYTQQLNKLRLKLVADQFPAGKSAVVDSWCERFYRRPGWADANVWFFRVGMALLIAGSVCVAIILVWLIVFESPSAQP
jgi:hypothetical protein